MASSSEPRLSPYAFLDRPTDAPLLIDAEIERAWTQKDVAELVEATAAPMVTGRRELVFNLCQGREFASVLGYLSGVRAGHAVAMLDGRVPDELNRALIERYRPAFVMRSDDGRELKVEKGPSRGEPVADDLQILLSTSGTTGSPKLARLSIRNIEAHTASIVDYLGIDEHERGMQSLPIHFSYGLSILNTHLGAGACLVLSPGPIIRRDFWQHAERWEATSFAGVPYSYAILDRAKALHSLMPDSMRTLTQSGGRLAPEAIVKLHELMTERGGRLFVMYGQTESTARMSYVPPDRLPEKAHTVGIPIPGGSFSIRVGDDEASEPEVEGEVIYRGPNVMHGYATEREDLVLGDGMHDVLPTGDVGVLDSEGFLRLTGRTKRIAKVYGLRVSLDEVEAAANVYGLVAAVDGGDRIVLWRLSGASIEPDDLRRELAGKFNLKSQAFEVNDLDELPLTGRDKVDYKALAKLSEA